MHKTNIQGNQEQRPQYPRLNGRSTWNNLEGGLGFYAGILGDMYVLREGTPPNKGKQGKTRKNKGKQGKPRKTRKTKENQGGQGETKGIKGKSSSPNEIRGISGIRITSKQWDSPIQIRILWVWGYVYVWVCVSLGDGGSVGSQGKRTAAMAWGRSRWSSVHVLLWR